MSFMGVVALFLLCLLYMSIATVIVWLDRDFYKKHDE